jgi:hypothetical protein
VIAAQKIKKLLTIMTALSAFGAESKKNNKKKIIGKFLHNF